jgi:Tfp pilus assembly protein PilZ
VKSIEITFKNGRDVLRSYWGFLSNGGLVLGDRYANILEVGDRVNVKVAIESSGHEYQLRGQVVRRPDVSHMAPEGTVIEFAPGEPHDLLLSAAWSETENVPARRYHRQATRHDLQVRKNGRLLSGRLLNISLGGCCVTVHGGAGLLRAGDQVELAVDEALAAGRVRWQRADDVGVQFDESHGEPDNIARFVRRFISAE